MPRNEDQGVDAHTLDDENAQDYLTLIKDAAEKAIETQGDEQWVGVFMSIRAIADHVLAMVDDLGRCRDLQDTDTQP